jgi:hypothetical protein
MPVDLLDFKVNIRIRLALLWVTIMALYIYADYFNLMTPGKLQGMLDLKSPFGNLTPGTLVFYSILLIIPNLMIPGSLLLKPIIAKWSNIVWGILYALISILLFFSSLSSWMTFFAIYQAIELFVFFLIIRTALYWPKTE